ncbi:DUF4386 family protein [Ornithinimicrobium sp. LYQ121]|uniref:DUF4386 family protein n=1 Tax=Ornithinimicrobium sp. LYQ121 TaxID=3378801 RepID=UPI003851E1BF
MQPHAPRLKRAGGFAALYVAAAYLAAIPYFVFLVDYPSVTDPADKVTLLVEQHTSMYVMHLISFEFVALALIVVTLGVYQHLYEHAPATSQVACAVGLIRAGLLLASVMVFDHGMSVVVDQQAAAPEQAVAVWRVIEPVADALGGTGGDVLGGVWLLLVSWGALRARTFPRALNWLGLTVGTAALLSAVPGLGLLEVGAGLLMIAWFLWFGVVTAWPRSTTSAPGH